MIEQQQQGSMTLPEFAALHGLTEVQAQRLAKTGRILGAQRNHTGRWLVFPPAKILEGIRAMKPRKRPLPYDDQRVKEAAHILSLATSKQPFSVQLTGTQILSIERLIQRECELLKSQNTDEFEHENRSVFGDRLQGFYIALRSLREATRSTP
jgi:hypothetical protein